MFVREIFDFFVDNFVPTLPAILSPSSDIPKVDVSEQHSDVVLTVSEAISKFVYNELGKHNIPIKDRLDLSISTLEFSSSVAFGSKFHEAKITKITKEHGDKIGNLKREQINEVLAVLQKQAKEKTK